MGGRGGRKGGLFGGVMESTAKLINSSDIGVRFKYVVDNRPAIFENRTEFSPFVSLQIQPTFND